MEKTLRCQVLKFETADARNITNIELVIVEVKIKNRKLNRIEYDNKIYRSQNGLKPLRKQAWFRNGKDFELESTYSFHCVEANQGFIHVYASKEGIFRGFSIKGNIESKSQRQDNAVKLLNDDIMPTTSVAKSYQLPFMVSTEKHHQLTYTNNQMSLNSHETFETVFSKHIKKKNIEFIENNMNKFLILQNQMSFNEKLSLFIKLKDYVGIDPTALTVAVHEDGSQTVRIDQSILPTALLAKYTNVFNLMQNKCFQDIIKIMKMYSNQTKFLVNVLRLKEPFNYEMVAGEFNLIYGNKKALVNSPDGNCLYNSCSQILFNSEKYAYLFRIGATFMLTEYRQFFNNLSDPTFYGTNKLVSILANNHQWGDTYCMLTLSILVNRPIHCFTGGLNNHVAICQKFSVNTEQSKRKPMKIGHNENHFYALFDVDNRNNEENETFETINEFSKNSLDPINTYENVILNDANELTNLEHELPRRYSENNKEIRETTCTPVVNDKLGNQKQIPSYVPSEITNKRVKQNKINKILDLNNNNNNNNNKRKIDDSTSTANTKIKKIISTCYIAVNSNISNEGNLRCLLINNPIEWLSKKFEEKPFNLHQEMKLNSTCNNIKPFINNQNEIFLIRMVESKNGTNQISYCQTLLIDHNTELDRQLQNMNQNFETKEDPILNRLILSDDPKVELDRILSGDDSLFYKVNPSNEANSQTFNNENCIKQANSKCNVSSTHDSVTQSKNDSLHSQKTYRELLNKTANQQASNHQVKKQAGKEAEQNTVQVRDKKEDWDMTPLAEDRLEPIFDPGDFETLVACGILQKDPEKCFYGLDGD